MPRVLFLDTVRYMVKAYIFYSLFLQNDFIKTLIKYPFLCLLIDFCSGLKLHKHLKGVEAKKDDSAKNGTEIRNSKPSEHPPPKKKMNISEFDFIFCSR